MSYSGFGKESGPSVPPKSQPVFGHTNPFLRPPSSSHPIPAAPFAASPSPPRPSDGQKLVYRDLDAPAPERPAAITTLAASRDSTTGITARVSRPQNPEKIRSPPLPYAGIDVSKYYSQTFLRNNHSNLLTDDHSQLLHLQSQSPPLVPVNYASAQNFRPSTAVQQPALASSTLGNQVNLSGDYTNSSEHQVQSLVSPQVISHNPWGFVSKLNSAQVSKRSRSPPLLSLKSNEVLQDNMTVAQKDLIRPLSPPKLENLSSILRSDPHAQKSSPSTVSKATLNSSISSSTKRTRSPPRLSSADETLEGKMISSNDCSEREMLAKAKRLARFKVELSKSEQNNSDIADQKTSANRNEQSLLEQKYVGGHSAQSTVNFTNGHAFSDSEGFKTSNIIIIGLCPDMCPESERAERERKGDLDQYERLDGDRNVTSGVLAVKKYNRTAEREASLIRPMPVLQKTVDYLLSLLDQPYDEGFLGMYNFLWDRMRAVRMDLRMQHIFNQGAITMLEQMIRLHIIAMHELCEYTKGEGFSEGFDAHLNIEQMNKTSVELFQMYDDHRKKGINVPTEKEFRGYYALLKLDKHPGYKVEPAELSLDLAKMTPEIRQTPEVLFARSVGRACRTSNFIAFFRLARKASYLQACLMHAHFAKLRTQALASLHAGLQNNQGLPVSHVANWLAMEDEDIEGLLEYHGFSVKAFEEPYMVREGPFLNIDNDYPTKCSKLVHKKRSEIIIEDVSPSNEVVSPPVETTKEIQMQKKYKNEQQAVSSVQEVISVQKVDEEMPDSEAILSPKEGKSGRKFKEMPIAVQHSETDNDAVPFSSSIGFFPHNIPEPQPTRSVLSKHTNSDAIFTSSPKRNLHSKLDGRLFEIVPKPVPPESSIGYGFHFSVAEPVPPSASKDESLLVNQVNEDEIDQAEENDQSEEIAVTKLKLFLRLWKRRASKLRMLREQRQFAANAALDSLSLGPPIRHHIDQPSNFDKFDIDKAMRERYEKQEKSWARLNLSEMVGDILSRRNSGSKCLCWKIILCSATNSGHKMGARLWLISKLMPSSDEDVVISSPGLTMWKKWVPGQCDADPACCFSVIRDTAFGAVEETVSGASAVLFLVSESIPWKFLRVQLHNLLMSIPSGAHLPLLILCGSYDKGFSPVIINELGLHDIDKSRISGFLLVFLIENQQMEHLDGFFSDRRLREGLEWLAGESPLQPTLECVKVRDLVYTHLNSMLRVLDSINNSRLGPFDCISAFNEALDSSVQEIVAAANANPAGWPCPEIGVLDQSSDEDRLLKSFLPPSGWSSNPKLQQIIRSFQDCKLPPFPEDFSWLALGSKSVHEIENHRSRLEGSLIHYLTDTSKMMGVPLATKEAHVILQSCARLKLCGSSYHIVPQWAMIFRRIFNWRLMSLSSSEVTSAYISESIRVSLQSSDTDVNFEANLPSSYYLSASLDEIIEIGCTSPILTKGQSRPLQQLHLKESKDVINETVSPCDLRDSVRSSAWDKLPSINNTVCTYGLDNARNEVLTNGKANREAKLSRLLEQCNLLQNAIDEKLSVYF